MTCHDVSPTYTHGNRASTPRIDIQRDVPLAIEAPEGIECTGRQSNPLDLHTGLDKRSPAALQVTAGSECQLLSNDGVASSSVRNEDVLAHGPELHSVPSTLRHEGLRIRQHLFVPDERIGCRLVVRKDRICEEVSGRRTLLQSQLSVRGQHECQRAGRMQREIDQRPAGRRVDLGRRLMPARRQQQPPIGSRLVFDWPQTLGECGPSVPSGPEFHDGQTLWHQGRWRNSRWWGWRRRRLGRGAATAPTRSQKGEAREQGGKLQRSQHTQILVMERRKWRFRRQSVQSAPGKALLMTAPAWREQHLVEATHFAAYCRVRADT